MVTGGSESGMKPAIVAVLVVGGEVVLLGEARALVFKDYFCVGGQVSGTRSVRDLVS